MEFVNLEPTFGFPENFPGKVTTDPKNKKTIKEIRDTTAVEIVKRIIVGHGELFQYIKTNKKIEKKIAIYAVNPTEKNPQNRTFTLFEPARLAFNIEEVKEEVEEPFKNDEAYNHAFFVREILNFSKEQIQEMQKNNQLVGDISGIIIYEAIQQNAGVKPFNFPTQQEEVVGYIKNNFHIHNLDYHKINWTQCHLINHFVKATLEMTYREKIYTPTSLKALITGSEIKITTEVKTPLHNTSGSSEIKKTKKECVLF